MTRHDCALLVCGLCIGGCTTSPGKISSSTFQPYRLAPQPTLAPESSPDGLNPDTEIPKEAGDFSEGSIYSALVRFTTEQRRIRESSGPGGNLPETARQNWTFLLGLVDRFLTHPAEEVELLDLIRTRLSIEAEIQFDQEHYLKLPDGLLASVKARTLALHSRLLDARPPLPNPPTPPFFWPVEPLAVASLFGPRADPFDGTPRFHEGIDLKAYPGQPVQAAAEGIVERAGWFGGHGFQVRLLHENGIMTAYSHLSKILVTTGTKIPAKGVLGLAGSTGRSTGAHLHFEFWRDTQPVDPLSEMPTVTIDLPISSSRY